MKITKQKLFELEKENYIKLPVHKLHNIRVLLSRLYRDERHLHKDIELLLFYIYQDWAEVESTIKKWKEENKNMI